MSLDLAIKLFDLVETFAEYKEGLREVLKASTKTSDPKASRERVIKIIDEKKQELMDNKPEFKAIMDHRAAEAKRQSEYDRAIHKAKMSEAKSEASRARTEAMARIPDIDDWVAKTRVRKAPIEELENKSEMFCPICGEKDTSGNIVNNEPTCMKDMHRLVPKSELKNYNRKYRRAWKRK